MTDPQHHAGDALSALVDGELSISEAEAVRAHVAWCGECADELDAVRAARRTLRMLPAVEPPSGFLASLQPDSNVVVFQRRRPRTVAANAAAAAAAALVAVVLLGSSPTPATAVAAQPAGAAGRHDSTVAALTAATGSGGSLVLPTRRITPTTAPLQDVDDLPSHLVAPEALIGYRLVAAYRIPNGVHLLYEKGEHRLSVFEQKGRLRVVPGDVTRFGDVWRWDAPDVDGKVVVTERGGVVITVVGDESAEAVLAAARALPEMGGDDAGPIVRRLGRACAEVLEALSPAS